MVSCAFTYLGIFGPKNKNGLYLKGANSNITFKNFFVGLFVG